MFRNYLIVAVRNLLGHKAYSGINIFGLAIGMACCVLILLYIQDELSYDRNHEYADRICRVVREIRMGSGNTTFKTGSSGALGQALMSDFPEVRKAVRVLNFGGRWVRYGEKEIQQTVCLADKELLDVFTFPLIKGDRETVLNMPSSAVITEEMAAKVFGDEDPIGKVLTVQDRYLGGDYKITGILKDIPEKTTFRFDLLTSTVSPYFARWAWEGWRDKTGWLPIQTYILLAEGHDYRALERKLPDFMERHMGAEVRAQNTYHLQPFNRIYLYSNVDYDISWYGDITQIYLFSVIALFILLIACINFMNLATARSANRAREVGMRKVVGAFRVQLIWQFLGESVLMAFLALALAVGLVQLVLSEFNAFTGKELALNASTSATVLLGLPSIALFVGLVAGSYPAFFLSAFQPAEVMKGSVRTGSGSAWLRKGLVVFQFAISILLIIGTVVVQHQLDFISNRKLGFDKEQVVLLPLFGIDRSWTRTYNTVKDEFLKHPDILEAAASHLLPGGRREVQTVRPEGEEEEWQMRILAVDEDFLDMFGIEVIAGRNLSREIVSDSTDAFILNETAVRQLGWKDPVGKRFEWGDRKGMVVGVVKDFHVASLHEEIEAVFICMWQRVFNVLSLKIRTDNIPETVDFLREKWKEFIPNRPFNFQFMDQYLDRLYRSEQRFGQISGIFSLLAIFVACLGLFGLASFTAEQRTKEIGVRKVLGASVSGIVLLFSKEFLKLVLVANLIAWPAAYYLMDLWLQDFVYRIHLEVWAFALGGILALLIALLTVGTQAVKAAIGNPVDALRYE